MRPWMIGFKEIYKYLPIIGISQGDPFAAEVGPDREISVPLTVYRERPQLTPNAVRGEKKNQPMAAIMSLSLCTVPHAPATPFW